MTARVPGAVQERWFATAAAFALALLLACAACGGGGSGHAVAGPRPGGAAARAKLPGPSGLALDSHGNLYVSEFDGSRVVRITPAGRLTIVAGTGTPGYTGDGSRAVAARLSEPNGLALDAHGNLAIADSGNDVIRKVDPAGRITTFMKPGKVSDPIGLAFNGDDLYVAAAGDGRVLRIRPSGSLIEVARDVRPGYLVLKRGNLYLSDSGHNTVIEIAAQDILKGREGAVTTIAGTEKGGFSGDGGAATDAQVQFPSGIVLDAKGNLYVADSNNNRVRKVDRDGIITTVAGTGVSGFSGDGGGATAARLDTPVGLAVDGAGNLYIADHGNNRVRRVDAKGVIATVAGSGAAGPGPGRVATKVELSAPEALAVDGQGNLYVSEFLHARVVKISRTGQLAVVAGTGIAGYSGDGRRAGVAQLSAPAGLAFDSGGNLLIADYGNRVIRKVDPAGVITTIPASVKARLHDPVGLASRGGDLYVADAGDARVVRIRASGSLSVVATRVAPAYLLLDGAARLDMSDFVDHRIKQIDVSNTGRPGVISLVAGTGTAGFSGDGGPATKARLNVPYGLAMDARGNLYFSDRENNRVRRVDRHGVITTIAGSGVPGFAGDGGPATAARLNSPVGLAIDAGGNLYVADSGNNRVRRVDPHGVITTIAGG
jgi:sugar lactone lactonase YvrE